MTDYQQQIICTLGKLEVDYRITSVNYCAMGQQLSISIYTEALHDEATINYHQSMVVYSQYFL